MAGNSSIFARLFSSVDFSSIELSSRKAGNRSGAIVGPVETILSKDGVRAYAGLRDDPFFFDLQGFRETRSTGTLRFDKTRNFFAGKNDTIMIIEIPKSRLGGSANTVEASVTTARFGGQL